MASLTSSQAVESTPVFSQLRTHDNLFSFVLDKQNRYSVLVLY